MRERENERKLMRERKGREGEGGREIVKEKEREGERQTKRERDGVRERR